MLRLPSCKQQQLHFVGCRKLLLLFGRKTRRHLRPRYRYRKQRGSIPRLDPPLRPLQTTYDVTVLTLLQDHLPPRWNAAVVASLQAAYAIPLLAALLFRDVPALEPPVAKFLFLHRPCLKLRIIRLPLSCPSGGPRQVPFVMSLSDAGDNFENEGLCQPGNENTGEWRHRLLVTEHRPSGRQVSQSVRQSYFISRLPL